MATLPPNATQDEIENELDFYTVLIDSLDQGADDYAEKLAELEGQKNELEQRLKVLEEGGSRTHTAASQSQVGMDSHGDRPDWWQSPPLNDIPDGDGSNDDSFETQVSGMKRPRSDSLRHDTRHPYKRPTPQPSYTVTPESSTDSFESYDDTNSELNRRARHRQLAAEAELKRQREAQLADEQFARNLSQQTTQPDFNGMGSSSSQRPTFQTTLNHKGSYQRPPPSPVQPQQAATASPPMSNSFNAPWWPNYTPQSFGQRAYPQYSNTGQQLSTPSIRSEPSIRPQPYIGSASHIRSEPRMKPESYIKSEPGSSRSQQPFNSRAQPEIIDLTASDNEDADLSEITPNGFTPGNLSQRPAHSSPLAVRTVQQQPGSARQSMPGAYPTPLQSGLQQGSNLYPGPNLYGYQSVYGQGNSMSSTLNQSQHTNPLLANAMNGIRNAASSLVSSLPQFGVNSYGTHAHPNVTLGSSVSSGNAQPSSSSALPFNFDGDYDLLFNGSRQLPSAQQQYAGHGDLYNRRFDELAEYNPEKTKEEINALLENIRPDEAIPADLRVKTPEAMTIKLHKYQESGLTWLKQCEEGSNKGGILADDMGLGKTIQMLALIVEHKSVDPRRQTTLIVAPLALMRQWKQEAEQKVKPGRHRLNVFIQHGPTKKKSFQDLRMFDIVLTTYGTLATELKKLEALHARQKFDPNARPRNAKEECVLIGEDCKWYRVILDEAQCIKNKSTRTAQAANYINAQYRFCMTGTPMMNNVEEFFSLVQFLRINPYRRWNKFRLDISSPLRSANENAKQAAMTKLQALCQAVMLRRTKKSTFEGKPILVLPERTMEIENPIFDDDEKAFYKALETSTRLRFNKYLARDEVGTHYSAVLVLLLRLRQAACHPHLIKDFGIAGAADITEEQVIDFAGQLEPNVVQRIKDTNGNFECPVCYDAVSNPAIFIPCGHDTCRECFTRITDPANGIRDGNENGGGAKCPNCRHPIDPKRVTDFDAFKKVHMPELLTKEEQEALEVALDEDKDEDDEDDSDSDSSETENDDDEDDDEVNEQGDLKNFIVDDEAPLDSEPCSDADESNDVNEEGVPGPAKQSKKPKKSKSKRSDKSEKKTFNKKKGKGKEVEQTKGKKKSKLKNKKKAVTLADLAKLSLRNAGARRAYLRRLRETYVDSTKIRRTMELLRQIIDDAEGEKVLVFSQWTSLLDLIEIPISGEGWDYRRYDGSMNSKMRADAVDDFRDHKQNVRIMLVSLKAGNAGLNLNMANQVIILDPFWNPFIEEQAIDRAHRIGQTRPVKVHRILVAETVEDRIVELQERKRALIGEALDESAGHKIARLGVRELKYLFGSSNSL